MTADNPLTLIGQQARAAAAELAHSPVEQRDAFLMSLARNLRERTGDILKANKLDFKRAKERGMQPAQLDRLELTEARLSAIADSLKVIHNLPDPVGEVLERTECPNGLLIERRAIPIGTIGIIYESRPNVTIDAAAISVKSGNSVILRGGSEIWNSQQALVDVARESLERVGLPVDCVQPVLSADRKHVKNLLTLRDYVDVIIPRGGIELVQLVRDTATIRVISQFNGVCHTYIDAEAAPFAVPVTLNAKMRRTSICGATECLLLHEAIQETIGKDAIKALLESGCEVRVPGDLLKMDNRLVPVDPAKDYGHEFLDKIIAIAVVPDVRGAVAFVNRYGSGHTDSIITENKATADFFADRVNSAIAAVNTSTQFADGGEFGMGAEIGISTDRFPPRGPVGLRELQTYKYVVRGNGQVRPAPA